MTKFPPDNRGRPPEDDEWAWIWDASDKSHKMWRVGGGAVYAAVTNWKAWAATLAFVGFIKSNDIIAIIITVLEISK